MLSTTFYPEIEVLQYEANQMVVTCPEGVSAGELLAVTTADGRELEVAVPDGVAEGEEFTIEVDFDDEDDIPDISSKIKEMKTGMVKDMNQDHYTSEFTPKEGKIFLTFLQPPRGHVVGTNWDVIQNTDEDGANSLYVNTKDFDDDEITDVMPDEVKSSLAITSWIKQNGYNHIEAVVLDLLDIQDERGDEDAYAYWWEELNGGETTVGISNEGDIDQAYTEWLMETMIEATVIQKDELEDKEGLRSQLKKMEHPQLVEEVLRRKVKGFTFPSESMDEYRRHLELFDIKLIKAQRAAFDVSKEARQEDPGPYPIRNKLLGGAEADAPPQAAWSVKKGAIVKTPKGRLGVVIADPDENDEVKLLFANGRRSVMFKADNLTQASDAEWKQAEEQAKAAKMSPIPLPKQEQAAQQDIVSITVTEELKDQTND